MGAVVFARVGRAIATPTALAPAIIRDFSNAIVTFLVQLNCVYFNSKKMSVAVNTR
jgi:hypothetical protein